METSKKHLIEQIEPLADSPEEYQREVQEIASYGREDMEFSDRIPKGGKPRDESTS